MDPKKRKSPDFATELEVVQRVQRGEKRTSVTKAYHIPCSMLCALLKTEEDIRVKATDKHQGACCVRTVALEKIEKVLYALFLDICARNLPVDEPMPIEKTKCFASIFHDKNFNCGTG